MMMMYHHQLSLHPQKRQRRWKRRRYGDAVTTISSYSSRWLFLFTYSFILLFESSSSNQGSPILSCHAQNAATAATMLSAPSATDNLVTPRRTLTSSSSLSNSDDEGHYYNTCLDAIFAVKDASLSSSSSFSNDSLTRGEFAIFIYQLSNGTISLADSSTSHNVSLISGITGPYLLREDPLTKTMPFYDAATNTTTAATTLNITYLELFCRDIYDGMAYYYEATTFNGTVKMNVTGCLRALQIADTTPRNGRLIADPEYIIFLTVLFPTSLPIITSSLSYSNPTNVIASANDYNTVTFDELSYHVQQAFDDFEIDDEIRGPKGTDYLYQFCQRVTIAIAIDTNQYHYQQSRIPTLAPSYPPSSSPTTSLSPPSSSTNAMINITNQFMIANKNDSSSSSSSSNHHHPWDEVLQRSYRLFVNQTVTAATTTSNRRRLNNNILDNIIINAIYTDNVQQRVCPSDRNDLITGHYQCYNVDGMIQLRILNDNNDDNKNDDNNSTSSIIVPYIHGMIQSAIRNGDLQRDVTMMNSSLIIIGPTADHTNEQEAQNNNNNQKTKNSLLISVLLIFISFCVMGIIMIVVWYYKKQNILLCLFQHHDHHRTNSVASTTDTTKLESEDRPDQYDNNSNHNPDDTNSHNSSNGGGAGNNQYRSGVRDDRHDTHSTDIEKGWSDETSSTSSSTTYCRTNCHRSSHHDNEYNSNHKSFRIALANDLDSIMNSESWSSSSNSITDQHIHKNKNHINSESDDSQSDDNQSDDGEGDVVINHDSTSYTNATNTNPTVVDECDVHEENNIPSKEFIQEDSNTLRTTKDRISNDRHSSVPSLLCVKEGDDDERKDELRVSSQSRVLHNNDKNKDSLLDLAEGYHRELHQRHHQDTSRIAHDHNESYDNEKVSIKDDTHSSITSNSVIANRQTELLSKAEVSTDDCENDARSRTKTIKIVATNETESESDNSEENSTNWHEPKESIYENSDKATMAATSAAADMVSSSNIRVNMHRHRVYELVQKACPNELDYVDDMLKQFDGKEEELIQALQNMLESPTSDDDDDESSSQEESDTGDDDDDDDDDGVSDEENEEGDSSDDASTNNCTDEE